jgi:hypothetical protein
MIVCAQGLGLCQNALRHLRNGDRDEGYSILLAPFSYRSLPSRNFVRSGEVKSRDSCMEI